MDSEEQYRTLREVTGFEEREMREVISKKCSGRSNPTKTQGRTASNGRHTPTATEDDSSPDNGTRNGCMAGRF